MTHITIAAHSLAVDLNSDAPGATREEIDQWLADGMGGFTRDELSAAFDEVKDRVHWKNPIDALVELDRRLVLEHAIPYFTGTPAKFEEVAGAPGMLRVTADGYFAGRCN